MYYIAVERPEFITYHWNMQGGKDIFYFFWLSSWLKKLNTCMIYKHRKFESKDEGLAELWQKSKENYVKMNGKK